MESQERESGQLLIAIAEGRYGSMDKGIEEAERFVARVEEYLKAEGVG